MLTARLSRWLQTPFSFPEVTGQKILVLGLGGGCDIITAYAVTHLLPPGARSIVYANTKNRVDASMECFSPHLAKLKEEVPLSASGRPIHFSTRIDHSVPRGAEGCPWIFLLPSEDEHALVEEIRAQQFDALIGVDTGGDSFVSSAESGEHGRDKRMVRILQATGLPLLHLIVGPGADGESDCEALQEAFVAAEKEGRYLGCLSLEPVFPLLAELTASLSPKRTPRIILSAARGHLVSVNDGRVIVPRGLEPKVPREWLTHLFAFANPRG